MTVTSTTRPDVDLTDGTFYAGDSRAVYRWMRENEPVFRDRNGLAAASTYQAVIEAERNPELFSNAGGIRPDQPGVEMMIEMDDPQHLLRRKLVNYGFTRKRVKNLEASITSLMRHVDRRGVRTRRVRLRLGPRRAPADGGHRRHARGASGGTRDVPQVVRRSARCVEQHRRRSGYPGHHGCLRRLQRIHDGHDRGPQIRTDRRPGQRPGARGGRRIDS